MKPFVKKLALSLGLSLAVGLAVVHLGCGSSSGNLGSVAGGRRDAKVPEGVALRIRACAAQHMVYERSGELSVSFDVKLSNGGEVDSVALRESTLNDESLEACIAGALRSLSEADLRARRSESRPLGSVPAESRALLGQTQALSCLASPPCLLAVAFLIGAAYVTVQVYVHAASQSSTAKPKPRTAETATAVPTTTVVPVKSKKECVDRYVYCTDHTPKAPCGDCIHICTTRLEWPHRLCPQ